MMNRNQFTESQGTVQGILRKAALAVVVVAVAGMVAGGGAVRSLAAADTGKPGVQLLDDASARISAGGTMTVSFPEAMVPAAEIDVETAKSPIVFVPKLAGHFLWKSQTEGEFTFTAVAPGTQFQVLLAPGLKDLAGRPVGKPGESLGVRSSGEFKVESDFEETPTLERRPAVVVTSSATIKPADLAETAWFQDRDSRKRYPAEVIVNPEEQEKELSLATVTPREDLPVGRTFDLIVEGLKDAGTGTAMKGVLVKSLGTTAALKVVKVAAFNYPMKPLRITVQFSEAVHAEQGTRIRIEPKVAVKCVAQGDELWLEGAFDIHQKYRVTVPAEVTGKRGFPMADASVWSANFHGKKPSLIFPTEDLHERAQLGLRFGFIQVNTGALHWRLARVPAEKLLAINRRLREFTEEEVDPSIQEPVMNPETGVPVTKPSESLIDASRLEMVAQGEIEASPAEADTRREITWKPGQGGTGGSGVTLKDQRQDAASAVVAGPYVLEVTAKLANGKTLVNRALIHFTEYAAGQKRVHGAALLRVTRMGTGQPVEGMRVRVIGHESQTLGQAVTDRNGVAEFDPRAQIGLMTGKPGAEWFYLETPEGPLLQPVEANRFMESGFDAGGPAEASAYRLLVTSDRPIYRPGQLLKIKGFAREVGANGDLRVPRVREVGWQITGLDEPLVAGKAKLDGYGGFEAEWKVPNSAAVGAYQVGASLEDTSVSQDFVVQEFRPPPFLVALTDLKLTDGEGGVRVTSHYFHGAPNAGAHVRWEALWTAHRTTDMGVVVTDGPRATTAHPDLTEKVTGEGTLGADGGWDVKAKPPFKDGVVRGWYDVEWTAEVTAADGQTIVEKGSYPVYTVPVELSVTTQQVAPKEGEANPLLISLKAQAMGMDQQPAAGTPLSVEIYRARTKSVKEQIAPNVYRYRNSVTYEKDQVAHGAAPWQKELPVKAPGDYLAVLREVDHPEVPPATGQVYVAGRGEVEFPVRDDETIGVTCDRKIDMADPQSGYVPGEKAEISVQAPFSGLAWVSIEAEQILDTLFVPLDGNASRFELPIKKEYGPCAWVTVYLLHPGGENHLPAERFGAVQIKVRRPDLVLHVVPVLAAKQVPPKGTISGEIEVTCEGRPVKDADLTVYAVDEAVLDAGDWHEPHLSDAMYPERPWKVGTYQGLPHLTMGVDEASLQQKGFIIGAGGALKEAANAMNAAEVRTNFPPLAFWKTHLLTNRDGKAPFSFPAPDGLTKYRIIALAQTKQAQFGTGSDGVELSKPVQLEPALPRFVRVGDEVELRVIVRQRMAEEMPVKVRCVTPLTLAAGDTQVQKAPRGVPTVYRFRAAVGERESALIRFETDSGSRDAVEVTIPVEPPTLRQRESLFGSLAEVKKKIPMEWRQSTGVADATLSTSPWLPKLTGLPLVLDYPHGCFEQITSRILAYAGLADLLEYLPEFSARKAAYRKRIENGLEQIKTSLSNDGYLPYWPGEQASPYPTVAGYWSVQSSIKAGLSFPEEKVQAMAEATRAIASGKMKEADPFCRAFALMVLSANPQEAKVLGPVIREMYLRRETYEPDVRALLAIGLYRWKMMPTEQQQLLREIDIPLKEQAFNPDNFGSTTRCEAIRALAFVLLNPEGTGGKVREQFQGRVDDFLDSSQSLSTQENFWLLLAFREMHHAAAGKPGAFKRAAPAPQAISPNGASALWSGMDIRKVADFAPRVDGVEALTCLMKGEFRTDAPATARADKGFRVERVTKNLTAATRDGSAEAPYHLGDQILITYRLISPKLHHFVAVEDELPAGLETINPNIASIARSYSVPQEKGTVQLGLSHSELRDHVSYLYFDRVNPGLGTYSVLARATCAGTFHWPATQAVPMYDSRFSGLSPSQVCHVSGE
jgi:uncharacterized protein YfaS (alpha-2-macroglobulin family)